MNLINSHSSKHSALLVTILCSVFILSGCGGGGGGGGGHSKAGAAALAYDHGFDDGFADDTEYFLGYDDSFLNDTVDTSFYQGDTIPFSAEITYDAGYWDGQFDAYNDGYFVAYRYAFIIGFSEGYDNAYWPDYLDFLANDWHDEYLHAGFSDGYNDGFSEGRIFGAYDYEAFWASDWLDAFLDWEYGTDLYFAEVDKGTGVYGPVILYEWGSTPYAMIAFTKQARSDNPSPIRMRANTSTSTKEFALRAVNTLDVSRTLSPEQEAALNITPTDTTRTSRALTLSTTWRERIDTYQQQGTGLRSAHRTRTGTRTAQ